MKKENEKKEQLKQLREDQRIKRNEQRLKKLDKQKVYLKSLIGILLTVMTLGTLLVYVGAHKDGISWEEVDKMHLAEQKEEGHLGGQVNLIEQAYENEISKEEFKQKKEAGETFNVYFYSPYCPYCFNYGEDILQVLAEQEESFVVVDVNRDVEFQEQENIQGVPGVVKYENGEQIEILTGTLLEEFLGEIADVNTEN